MKRKMQNTPEEDFVVVYRMKIIHCSNERERARKRNTGTIERTCQFKLLLPDPARRNRLVILMVNWQVWKDRSKIEICQLNSMNNPYRPMFLCLHLLWESHVIEYRMTMMMSVVFSDSNSNFHL